MGYLVRSIDAFMFLLALRRIGKKTVANVPEIFMLILFMMVFPWPKVVT